MRYMRFVMHFRSKKYKVGTGFQTARDWQRTVLFGLLVLVLVASTTAGGYALFGTKSPPPRQDYRPASGHSPAQRHNTKPYGLAVGDDLVSLNNEQLNRELSGMADLGVDWVRIDVAWADVQPNNATQYDWSSLDRVVTAAHQHGLSVLGTLAYTPQWARPADCQSSQQCAPASDHQFATFAHAAATRYAHNGIGAWEIWNEENNEGFWQPAPSPAAYTNLLMASYKAVTQANPHATVITGGLGPLDSSAMSIQQQTFLSDMYTSGAGPYFNAVGYHPYSFPALPSHVASWSGWSTMADVPNSIRSIMTAHHDSAKKIWITEYGAPTGGPGALATTINFNFGLHADHVSNALQTEMLTQAISQYKADSWLGSFFWYDYQDSGNSTATDENFFGLLNQNGTKKPAYYAYHAAIDSKK